MALNQVPQAGQTLGVTRAPILQNFATIDTAFTVDHVTYNVAGQGKHNKVTFPLNPGAVFLANEMGLFNQNAAPTNRPDIWMARGVAAAIPITGYLNNNANATNGFSYLPSGLKIIWGTATIVAGGQITITYATAVPGFPGFSTFWGPPVVSRIRGVVAADGVFVIINAYTATTATVFSSDLSNNVQFSWYALGL